MRGGGGRSLWVQKVIFFCVRVWVCVFVCEREVAPPLQESIVINLLHITTKKILLLILRKALYLRHGGGGCSMGPKSDLFFLLCERRSPPPAKEYSN